MNPAHCTFKRVERQWESAAQDVGDVFSFQHSKKKKKKKKRKHLVKQTEKEREKRIIDTDFLIVLWSMWWSVSHNVTHSIIYYYLFSILSFFSYLKRCEEIINCVLNETFMGAVLLYTETYPRSPQRRSALKAELRIAVPLVSTVPPETDADKKYLSSIV